MAISTCSDPIGSAHRAIEPAVRLLVRRELLPQGVPAERAAEPDGDVSDVAGGDRAVADLDVGDRAVPRDDASLPVQVMPGAPVERHLARPERPAADLLRFGAEEAAVDGDLPQRPDELDAVHAHLAAVHHHAAG